MPAASQPLVARSTVQLRAEDGRLCTYRPGRQLPLLPDHVAAQLVGLNAATPKEPDAADH